MPARSRSSHPSAQRKGARLGDPSSVCEQAVPGQKGDASDSRRWLSRNDGHYVAYSNGLSKTMLAQNICHTAVLAGRSVLFRPAAALLEDLHRQSPEGRRRRLRTYANVDLLCIDEVGYLSFDDKAADLLYEVVNRRYERKSLIITTNRPFKEWNEVFPNATCIATLLDRLLHHADATVIEGASYRIRESEQETAARRRKKP